jgi:lysophospholipase L1-like esterase
MDVSNRKSIVTDATSFCATAGQVSNVDFIKPITRKSPEKIILHVGMNDLKNSPAKVIADSLLNLTTQIKETRQLLR